MSDQEKSVWLVFNGEIYNYPEIRKKLEGYFVIMSEKQVKEISRYSRIYDFTLATAESCTGGHIANTITNTERSSDYFLGGFVTYSNESKIRDLKIELTTLEQFGVYSSETAIAMAKNIREIFSATIGISTTGIAPPRNSLSDEQTGKVYIGISSASQVLSKTVIIETNNRQEFKKRVTEISLDFLIENIQNLLV